MSNQQTENPESQITAPKKLLLPKRCLILLVAAIIVCVAPLSLPKLTTVVNQIKWHTSGITDYSISVVAVGVAVWPANLAVPVLKGKQEVRKISVDELFLLAYECFLFCSVNYDPVYGYPTQISKGFIEGGALLISVKPNTP